MRRHLKDFLSLDRWFWIWRGLHNFWILFFLDAWTIARGWCNRLNISCWEKGEFSIWSWSEIETADRKSKKVTKIFLILSGYLGKFQIICSENSDLVLLYWNIGKISTDLIMRRESCGNITKIDHNGICWMTWFYYYQIAKLFSYFGSAQRPNG